jgi:hypothetical protein
VLCCVREVLLFDALCAREPVFLAFLVLNTLKLTVLCVSIAWLRMLMDHCCDLLGLVLFHLHHVIASPNGTCLVVQSAVRFPCVGGCVACIHPPLFHAVYLESS